ncbi:hypothetical protein Tco_1533927, partial [Tanacetum coccineum]
MSVITWSYKVVKIRYSFPRSNQIRRDVPKDNPLDSVEVLRHDIKRSKSENKGIVPIEMELVLEQTQQGISHKVSVSTKEVEELKRKVKIKGEKKEALLTLRQKLGVPKMVEIIPDIETYSCEYCGGSPHPGFDCQTGNTPIFDQGPCYNQDFGYDQSLFYSHSLPQQFDCCEIYGGPHYSYDCQSGNVPVYDQGPCYNQNFSDDQPSFYSPDQKLYFDCCEVCGGPHYTFDCQTRNQLVYEPSPGNKYDFPCFDQPLQYHIDQDLDFESDFMRSYRDTNRILEELLRTLKTNSLVGEPEGSIDFIEVPFDDEQILRQHNTAHVTPLLLAYTPTPPVLATMEPLDTFLMGDEVVSTIPERENDEFIKSSVDELIPILKESDLTLDSTDLECREHLDTLSKGDREIDFNPIRDIEELERLLADDLVPVPKVFDVPLGHSDSISRSFDVTFSNSLFDFKDDFNLCYDNPLFDEEFEDISRFSMIVKTSVLVFNPPITRSRISFVFISWEILNPDLIFDPFLEILSDESKVHIEVLSVLWGNRLPIPDGSLPLSSLNSIPADNVPAGRSSSIPADYVSAGHVLVPADKPMPTIPTQSPFTYPIPNSSASPSVTQDDTFMPNPSASPSFTQDDTFMPEPIQPMPTFTQTAFSQPAVHTQHTHPAQTNPTGQQYPNNVQSQQFQQFQTATISANNAKFPYLEKEKYEIWAMKMEYWIQNADHNLWRIVQQGNSPKRLGKDAKGNTIVHPPVSLDEHVAVQRENKVRTLLLQALPEDHMPDFHHYDDARDIWMAVKARFGGNEESKKMKKTMLKQQFAEFSVTEEEGLHKGYDRFQKILSQLNQVQARPDNDDINLKFLRALPSSWSQVALALKTRGGLES